MAINLGYSGDLNVSLSIGDNIYQVETSTLGGFAIGTIPQEDEETIVLVGAVTSIQTNTLGSSYYTPDDLLISIDNESEPTLVTTIITIEPVDGFEELPPTAFLFFSKDNQYHMSVLTGYYGEVKYRNNSTEKAELFATACGIVESSK